MAKSTISFEDSEEGTVVNLNFDTPLPVNPEHATQAQVDAMTVFSQILSHDGRETGEDIEDTWAEVIEEDDPNDPEV